MKSSKKDGLGVDEQGLRYKLFIVEALIFVLPFLVLSYIFYKNNIFLSLSQLLIFAMILVLVLGGLVILRQIFDKFFLVANSMKKAVDGDLQLVDIQSESGELQEITVSFNKLMRRFEDTTSELKRRVFELFALKELTETASRSLDFEGLLSGLLEKAMAVSSARMGSILMVEAEKQRFRVVSTKGLEQGPPRNSYINMSDSIASYVVSDRTSLLVQDIESDSRTLRPNDPKYGPPSFLSMPIYVRDQLIAVLNLSNKDTDEVFDSNDEQFLSIMIGEIGFALENAQLHSKVASHLNNLQERTSELTLANEQLKQEITMREEMEEALRESEENFRAVVEDMPALICRFSPDNKLTFANDSFADYYEQKSEDLIGRDFFHFIPEEDKKAIRNQFDAIDQQNPIITFEHQVTAPDGTARWQQWVGRALLDETGKVLGYQALGRDVTELKHAEAERRKLEAQLLQTRKLEAVGTLAGGIAHDFNNLLMGIQGNASLMLLHTDTTHPNHDKLKKIEQYVESGADLTRQILGFARAGKYHVETSDLNEVVETTSVMFNRTRKEIKVYREYEKDLWMAKVDVAQIEQVLLNLYVNSWQVMPEGGDLYLETANVVLSDDEAKPFGGKPGRYVKITIRDTGPGMDAETQAKIFDPFYTTKDMGRGAGLGLASVYGIVRNHGGTVTVISEMGKGSIFSIFLPASEEVGLIEEETLFDKLQKGSETILIVDDEDMIVDVGGEILKSLGYKVLLARSGAEAIEIYKKQGDEIDMIILDMIMPEMGGAETFQNLKEINPEVKVLLSSGYSIDGLATEIIEKGCNGFIQKPFNMNDLSQKIREILEKKNNANG